MILVKLKGGLGNQMFQYAFARRMSIKNEDVLKLDIVGLQQTTIETKRDYALGVFDIRADIATPEETQQVKYPYGFLSKIGRLINAKVLRRFYIDFDQSITERTGNMYLDGFFQDERYFNDASDAIRDEFKLKDQMSDTAEKMRREIEESTQSVSVHIRRGDYVTDAKTNAHHGTCGLDYYESAVSRMRENIGACTFYVFSDDIQWVKENMNFTDATYVSSPAIKDYEELMLMSHCKHNIIANSSFSWWGAWLNRNSSKVVIAPARWIHAPKQPSIIPSTWTRI